MGNVGTKVGAIVGGVIALVIGMVLATTVNTQAATTGSAANIGSFAGAGSINDLIPLVYISSILLLGVSLFALGGAGMAGVGPLGGR
jgi:hypothetical protein|tara:strand:+ start:1036 stop:1296 length:261 start_codon:yes stop_codon:yes gene_type:complete